MQTAYFLQNFICTNLLVRALSLFMLCTTAVQGANPVVHANSVYLIHKGLFRLELPSLTTYRVLPAELAQGEPVLSGDTVVLANSRGVHAYSALDGSLRWQWRTLSRVFAPHIDPRVGHGGRVYAGSEDGQLLALNLATGALLWQRQFGGWVYAPAIASNALILAGQEPLVRALNPHEGTTLWQYPLTQESVHYPVLAASDTVIITSFSGQVLALDVNSGALRWQIQDTSANHSPLSVGSTLYFRTFAGPVIARDRRDGRELWRSSQSFSAQPLQWFQDSVLAVDEFGAVVRLAGASGTVLQRYTGTGGLIGTAVGTSGRLLFFRDAGGANAWPQLTVISWSPTTNEERQL